MPLDPDLEKLFPARLHDFLPSGNGYKVRFALGRLGLPYTYREVDILRGGSRTPEFLARNPNGRIPVLELADGTHLAESNAILWFLGEGTPLVPDARLERARVLQWLFFEQYSHEPFIARRRFWVMHPEKGRRHDHEMAEWLESGHAALGVMEARLRDHPFLVADAFTLADVALFAYTHVAHEGGFDLAGYPALRSWIERVRAEPGYLPIDRVPG